MTETVTEARKPHQLYMAACNGWKPPGVRMGRDWDACSMEIESARRYLGSWLRDAEILECVAWLDVDGGTRLIVADFAGGRQIIIRVLSSSTKVTYSRWKELAPAQDAAR